MLDPVMRQTGAPGDVRGFDAHTGRLRWTFHDPRAGRSGRETWKSDSAARTGNANVWTIMSADESLEPSTCRKHADVGLLRRPAARRESLRGQPRRD